MSQTDAAADESVRGFRPDRGGAEYRGVRVSMPEGEMPKDLAENKKEMVQSADERKNEDGVGQKQASTQMGNGSSVRSDVSTIKSSKVAVHFENAVKTGLRLAGGSYVLES